MAYNWSTGGAGALSGAAAGSTFGPIGTAIGGLAGALSGFAGSDKMKKVPTMSKDQQNLLNQLMQMLGPQGQLGQGYQQGLGLQQQYMDPNSETMNQFSQPYIDQFNQQTVPGLAERFAGMGGMGGGLSSSGFGQSLSSAGGNLQNQLAQLKAGLGQQAAQSLMGQYGQMGQVGLNAQPFGYQQQAPSMAGGMLQGWGQSGFAGANQGAQGLYKLFGGG
jgi:hypothetical protein